MTENGTSVNNGDSKIILILKFQSVKCLNSNDSN